MPAQPTGQDFRVPGENAPAWLVLGITLAGVIGSTITAGLLLPNSSKEVGSGLPRSETTSTTTQVSAPEAEVGSGETPAVPDLADDQNATPDEENNSQEGETNAGPAVEQFLAELGTSDTPALDFGASGLEVVIPTVIVGLANQTQATQQPSGDQFSILQSGPGLTTGTDEESPFARETGDTPLRGDSQTATSVAADPTTSGLRSAGSKAHGDAASEQTAGEVASDCAPLFAIKFEHGSVEPKVGDMKQKMEALAAWLTAHPTATLYLDGHADASGPEEYNLVLSFRRADAVAGLLEGAGTPKTQLVVRAYGEAQSLSHSTESAFERRVDLTVDAGTPCDQPSPKGGDLR